jgi:energy-coupling factor transport system permease protein
MDAAGLPFNDFADREITSLSGGEKRRAAIAGVLAMDSEIILLDEPCAALDNKNKRRVMELVFEQQAKGKTVVVTTHSLETAAAFDYVAVMDNGGMTAFGPPEAVFGELLDPAWGLKFPRNFSYPPKTPKVPSKNPSAQSGSPTPQKPLPRSRRRNAGKGLFRTAFFGRFIGIDSPLRNLNPLVKIVLLLVLGTLSLAGNVYISFGVLGVVLFTGKIPGKIPFKVPLRNALAALPFLLLLAVFQIVFSWNNDQSAVLFRYGFFSVTVSELRRSLMFASRIVSIIAALSLYLAVTPLRETLSAINSLLSPLSRFGLPARDIGMIIGISLRFVPVLTEEAGRIITAQVSRGGKRGIRSSFATIIPLLLRSLERAETLANAMLLRLYKTDGSRQA